MQIEARANWMRGWITRGARPSRIGAMNGGARLRRALTPQRQKNRARRSLAPPGSWKAPCSFRTCSRSMNLNCATRCSAGEPLSGSWKDFHEIFALWTLNLVGTARCAVRAALSGALMPPAASRAGTSQRDVPTKVRSLPKSGSWEAAGADIATERRRRSIGQID